ncbi:anti-sigma regulatory factor (Ser/Thr protein kinase) [Geodermatophilus bullaregiensis]|uniref:ATP-binding protein n=1 Tax=Geodermatophilus bullaregiensis TaxID=1564160 RepID=UPI001957C51C|nr:ATP-binding protein [Geodermatophilus bullaregiensis]MBM7804362.1 anti-sigma regulatory factor (Ser/Thr protein kinase) [Geodermatophilus bullaregiensis]
MDAPLWQEQPPPPLPTPVYDGDIAAAADLTHHRGRLREELRRQAAPPRAGEDDLARLLLAFEELTSNGLRHGGRPVHVTVTHDDEGWLVDVTDAAPDRWPAPALDRDPAHGGLGLYMVARLSAAHGWWSDPVSKHVWAWVRPAPPT